MSDKKTKLQALEEEVATYRNILYTLNLRQEAFRVISVLMLGILVETRITTPGYIEETLRTGQLAMLDAGSGESNQFIEEFITAMKMAASMDQPSEEPPEGSTKH